MALSTKACHAQRRVTIRKGVMLIRKALVDDAVSLAKVFFDAVRQDPSPYTAAQREAWMPQSPDPERFAARLASKHVVLCEDAGEVIGFMTVEAGGYIDLAYVLPQGRGRGVFRALYVAIEQIAAANTEKRLWVHASLMAQPAFKAVGFTVIHHETVERAGEMLARAQMEKHLT